MKIKAFNGLNNTTDPLRAGIGWLATADNVNITDTGAIVKREGYASAKSGSFTGVFSTSDHQRLYLVDGGVLKTYDGAALAAGFGSAPMSWTELNGQVFYSNGIDAGIILPDNTVLDWRWDVPVAPTVSAVTGTMAPGMYRVVCTTTLPDGRETGPSDAVDIVLTDGQALQVSCTGNVYIAPANSTVFQYAGSDTLVWNQSPDVLGRELLTGWFSDPLPFGVETIQAWRGRIYAAMFMPTENQSVVWFSEPFGPHLFNLASSFFMVPGHAHMLAPTKDALIVGTDTRVYAYNVESITELAPYGTVPGQHWDTDDGRIIFWTTRGVCAALPFTNLTEQSVSVAPGVKAGGAIVRQGGQKRYLVSIQQGGVAFNSF